MNENKNKNGIIILLVIIIVILGVLCVLFATNKLSFNSNSVEETTNNKGIESIKVDTSKDYVYDATYSTNNKYIEFGREFADVGENKTMTISDYGIDVDYTIGMQYLSNLKVPYINIKSSDADHANNMIKVLYEKNAKLFDSCAEDANNGSGNPSCSQILTYRTYQYRNILSIVIIDSSQGTSPWVLNYTIYNFDLENGNKLSYHELLSKLSYDSSTVSTSAKNLIKNKMNELYGSHVGDFTKACYGESDETTNSNTMVNCYDKANNIFDESIQDDSILSFSDNNGNLNLFIIPYYNGVQNGELNHYLITINK